MNPNLNAAPDVYARIVSFDTFDGGSLDDSLRAELEELAWSSRYADANPGRHTIGPHADAVLDIAYIVDTPPRGRFSIALPSRRHRDRRGRPMQYHDVVFGHGGTYLLQFEVASEADGFVPTRWQVFITYDGGDELTVDPLTRINDN